MFDLGIINGKIIGHSSVLDANIYITNGKISAVSDHDIYKECKEVIDASGKMIFPGGIDAHAHLNDPGFNWREDFISGSRAAAAGGITTIIDMPLQNEPALTTEEIFIKKQEYLKNRSVVDYGFWGGLVDNNLKELKGLYRAGVLGLKAFIGPVSPDYSSVTLGIVREAMKIAVPLNLMLGFHCEDYSIVKEGEKSAIEGKDFSRRAFLESRPVIAELIATKNMIDLARETGARIHICHVSHPLVAEEIRKAKGEGIAVTGETCAHYLVFTEKELLEKGAIFKCAPPLRKEEDKERLWDYVIDGTLSCIASDHSPCSAEEKEELHNIFGAWGGISGIQSTFQVMFNEVVHKRRLCPTLLTRMLSYGPAKTFNLYPQKGSLEVGSDGDLVIVDPDKSWEITSDSLFYKNKISAFIGLKGKGQPILTILRGNIIYESGVIKGNPGEGKLIKGI